MKRINLRPLGLAAALLFGAHAADAQVSVGGNASIQTDVKNSPQSMFLTGGSGGKIHTGVVSGKVKIGGNLAMKTTVTNSPQTIIATGGSKGEILTGVIQGQ